MAQFRAPQRYVQTDRALADIGSHFDVVTGNRALIVGGSTALETTEHSLQTGLKTAEIDHIDTVRGVKESTEEQVSDIVSRIASADADLVVGVGGCSAIDAAKAAATRQGTDLAVVPTLASADGPASGISVIYDEAGAPADAEFRRCSPELVVVDTQVIAEAPAHFLRWGLGDTISTTFEAEACTRSGGTTLHGFPPNESGLQLARTVYDRIRTNGEEALADVSRNEVTPALESIVETIHLTSVLGWENAGGVAGAHALESGLRVAGVTEPPHGLLVGLCTVAQLDLENHDARDEVVRLLRAFGFEDPLPATVDIETAAEVACENPLMHNEPVDVTPDAVVGSLQRARELLTNARHDRN